LVLLAGRRSMDDHLKRAPSPPVGTQATAPSSTPVVVESGQSEVGREQPGDAVLVDPTKRDEKGGDPTPADEKNACASLHTSSRHSNESTSPAVDELVDDCDIPETIVEGVDEEEDTDDVGNVVRDDSDAQQRPVLFQPLLLGDDARAPPEDGLQIP
jgi:hypothetical protein